MDSTKIGFKICLVTVFALSVLSYGKTKDCAITNNYVLTATGQTSCYDMDGNKISNPAGSDALYGQDANYLKGSEMSYRNNGDGTITDMNTGLMWQEVPIPDGLTWEEAVKYCKKLKLAGYKDWRIPSPKELYSISDFSQGWPYLDTTYFKLSSKYIDKSEQYWTSAYYVGCSSEGGGESGFGVNHVTGHIKAYPSGKGMKKGDMPPQGPGPNGGPQGTPPPGRATGDMPSSPQGDGVGNRPGPPPGGQDGRGPKSNPIGKHVRAVRGESYGVNDYLDNGDGTISDRSTGLMWTQSDKGEGLEWDAALSYAENAEIAGHSDWRLPNVKELQSIVDYSFAPGAKKAKNEGPAIDPLFSCTAIVNEAGNDDYAYYWTSTSAHFRAGEPYCYAWYVAFGRAVNQAGYDTHGAGAVRFDKKYKDGPNGEGGERAYNHVRLVRDI